MLKSVRSRITILFSTLITITITILAITLGYRVTKELGFSYEQNAIDLLESTKNLLVTQHQSILFHEDSVLFARKKEINTNVNLVTNIITNYYNDYLDGKISLSTAQKKSIESIKNIRYSDNVGYFWINDTGIPFPVMIMHPTLPDLDNQVLDDPIFNCALGREENLFKAFVDVTRNEGEGYVDYLWPKPTPEGLSELQPKISYVKLFKPWNWIIGTGVYIDDIEKEKENRINKVLNELNEIIPLLKVGDSGYFFIFNKDGDVLVHPNLRGENISDRKNPLTGRPLTEELIETVNSESKSLTYLWDKPGYENDFKFEKKAYVAFFEPLQWYIASSIYIDDLQKHIKRLTTLILLSVLSAIISVGFISSLIANSVTKPIRLLQSSVKKVDKRGIPVNSIPVRGTSETRDLGEAFNDMINRIKKSTLELEHSEKEYKELSEQLTKHKMNLEKTVKERTLELEQSLEKLKIAQEKLIESERISYLGNLVSGVAHEVNTPIGIGVTAASHLEMKTKAFSKLFVKNSITKKDFEEYIEMALMSSKILLSNMERASSIIQTFKQVAVDQISEERRKFKVDNFISEMIYGFKQSIDNFRFKIDIDVEKELIIDSFPRVFYQIFNNLLNNSILHGFENMDKGIIYIRIYKDNKQITIEYKDTGRGIPADNIGKVFEPFFTTRRGKGSAGLGLNIVYNLVSRKLDGTISCNSENGKFTEFVIRFPI